MTEADKKVETALKELEEHFKSKGIPFKRGNSKGTKITFRPIPLKK